MLRRKVLGLLVPLVSLPLLVVSGTAYWTLKDEGAQARLSMLESAMAGSAQTLRAEIRAAHRGLDLIAQGLAQATLEGYRDVAGDPASRQVPEQFLAVYRQTLPDSYLLNLTLPAMEAQALTGLSGEPVFELSGGQTGKPRVLLSRALSLAGGQSGVLTLSVPLGLESLSSALPQGVRLYLADGAGRVLASPAMVPMGVAQDRLADLLAGNLNDAVPLETQAGPRYLSALRLDEGLFLVGEMEPGGMSGNIATMLGIALITLVLSLPLALMSMHAQLETLVIRPINRLRQLVRSLDEGGTVMNKAEFASDEFADLAASFQEVNDKLRASHMEIEQLAYFDSLTGLPNRASFNHTLEKELSHARRMDKSVALLIIDLDNFKLVNDVHGHMTGDLLLKETAVRLQESLRKADEIARQTFKQQINWGEMLVRLGGDEFIVLLREVNQAHVASLVATRIIHALSEPFHVNDLELKIGASIGIALYPMDGETPEQLIRSADLAMYEAKQKGRNNYQFFTASMNDTVSKRLAIENDLRRAIRDHEFSLYFQPKVDLRTGTATKFEGLIRWRHPERGIISPAMFIPVAEETGQIQDIGHLVLEMACQQIQMWKRNGLDNIQVSVNMSPLQLVHGDPAEDIRCMLDHYGLEGRNLEIEITESLLMQDDNRSIEVLQELRDAGVSIALDDFGSGYSSLAYLKRFPIDTIKIDRGFVIEMEKDSDSRLIIQSIVKLVRQLSLQVVVEGIETEGQLALVRDFECDYAQGYYFSPPVPADTLAFDFRHRLN